MGVSGFGYPFLNVWGVNMIANRIIQESIDDLKSVSGMDIYVTDVQGNTVAATDDEDFSYMKDNIRDFLSSAADSQNVSDRNLFRISFEDEDMYVIMTKGGSEESYTIGRIAAGQLRTMLKMSETGTDVESFFQNLLLDNLLLVDIHNRAKTLHIPAVLRRCVFEVKLSGVDARTESMAHSLLKGMFSSASHDVITSVNENSIILIKTLREGEDYTDLNKLALTICDMMNTEAMIDVKVSYGTIVNELREVSRSYKEAGMASEVGRIFYSERRINAYNTLGIGRLIYQLPESLCEMFMHEIFGEKIPDDLDEETITTVNKFFENNLNVSETARQLYVHRNTLVYRIEKLQKSVGLDIRTFDDALTLKIALMVVQYMKH